VNGYPGNARKDAAAKFLSLLAFNTRLTRLRFLPSLDSGACFPGGFLQTLKITGAIIVAGLPLLFLVPIAELETGGSESAFHALVFPDADVDSTFAELLDWFIALHVIPPGWWSFVSQAFARLNFSRNDDA
jgi:hypothetical protein